MPRGLTQSCPIGPGGAGLGGNLSYARAGCATYSLVLDQFKFNWKAAKTTSAGVRNITITVFNADGTTIDQHSRYRSTSSSSSRCGRTQRRPAYGGPSPFGGAEHPRVKEAAKRGDSARRRRPDPSPAPFRSPGPTRPTSRREAVHPDLRCDRRLAAEVDELFLRPASGIPGEPSSTS